MKGILERQMQLGLEICAPTRPCASAAPTEPEEVSEAARPAEQIPKVLDTELLSAAERAAAAEALEPARLDHSSDLVVFGAVLFIGQGGVGLGDIFESILRRRVIGVGVWVELLGELAIGAFDFLLR